MSIGILTNVNSIKTESKKLQKKLLSHNLYHNWVVSQDSDALVSQGRHSRENPMQKVLGPVRRVRFTQSAPRQASIRENKGPSLGKINVKIPRQRIPYALKFEDRSQEETERQQRCARGKSWSIAKHTYKLKEKTRLHSSFPRRNVYSRLHQQKSRRKESLW